MSGEEGILGSWGKEKKWNKDRVIKSRMVAEKSRPQKSRIKKKM